MKIMHISQSYPPMISGAALAAAQLAEGLAYQGHDVLVVAASDQRQGYATRNGRLHIERLPSLPNRMRANQRFLLYPQRQLQKLVQTFKPDIIHLHDSLNFGVCAVRIANKFHIPAILTLHQLPWFISKYMPAVWGKLLNVEQWLWRYGRWLLRQCAASVVPTALVFAVVQANTDHTPKIIPNGIDWPRFQGQHKPKDEVLQLRQAYGLSGNKPVILHVGRLDADKDVQDVIQAAARVLQHIDAELLVVGDGTQRQALMRQCQTLRIMDRSHFTGFVAPADLPDIYQLATLFVTASTIETFGIVIAEAMAAGCPVVACNATCIPELVKDNYSGLLVGPNDIPELAAKMIWLLENPKPAKAMGQAGQAISQQYDLRNLIQAYEQLYQYVLPIT